MSAPVLETIRPGVQFTPQAAASFRRAEASWGTPIPCNSTYRDWDLQLSMWEAWEAWVGGWGPKPDHSRAVHPDDSYHCKGEAVDTDFWTLPGFNEHMASHGWIRTAANDPTERHHFEYKWRLDQYFGQPTPEIPIEESEEDDMPKNCGHTYPVPTGAPASQQTWFAIFFNTGSGWKCEQSMPKGQKFEGGNLSKLAKTYDTTDMTETSKEYVDLLKESLAEIRPRG